MLIAIFGVGLVAAGVAVLGGDDDAGSLDTGAPSEEELDGVELDPVTWTRPGSRPVPPIPEPTPEELADTGAPTPDELAEDGEPRPSPVGQVEPATPPNYVALRQAEDFGPVRDAIEGNGGDPGTLYLGMSDDWAGRADTVAALRELASRRPMLSVRVFDFELTNDLFGLPSEYMAFAAVSVSPAGKTYPEVLQADRRTAGPLSADVLDKLARFALEGFEVPGGAEVHTYQKPGDVLHAIALWEEDGRWHYMVWRGGISTAEDAKNRGRASDRATALESAQNFVRNYKLGHAAGLGFAS